MGVELGWEGKASGGIVPDAHSRGNGNQPQRGVADKWKTELQLPRPIIGSIIHRCSVLCSLKHCGRRAGHEDRR